MLNERLSKITDNIDKYFYEEYKLYSDKPISNWVLDIEVSPISKNEVLTYSVALMCVDDETDICFKFKTVEETLKQLFNLKSSLVNIYVHNLYYDFKPFLIEYVNKWGAKQNISTIESKKIYNPLTHKKEEINTISNNGRRVTKNKNTYDIIFKNGQLYKASFFGDEREVNKNVSAPQELCFIDTLKIFPFSLKKASKEFINLELSKEGLDYEKERTLDDTLTGLEKKYIYEDVFALKYLVKKMCIEGFYIGNKFVKYTKMTNSSQSLQDYKETLLEDFDNNMNLFSNEEYKNEIETLLLNNTKFYSLTNESVKADLLFKKVFPPLNYFEDSWIRGSYYGGLSMVDFENVEKYAKYENKIGQVFDVNSLYPFVMNNPQMLLPVGRGTYNKKPYNKMGDHYKEVNKLYIQEIEIYSMKIKEGKTPFVQVKDRSDFNGREVLKENINLNGDKVAITLRLAKPLFELLFENYEIDGFKLNGHYAFRGKQGMFNNYLTFWGEVKKNSKGCERAISKLRQNALYGKFGTNGENELMLIGVENDKWNVESTHINYVSDSIYLPMATFITSYAKRYLITNINKNRDRFLYCDTDSIHLFGELKEVKGLFIDSKIYGGWKHELTFYDFKYLGAKRYAEYDGEKWDIKCCGLTSKIMEQIKDIETFTHCEYTSRELKKIKLYTKKDDVYYYKDKECTIKVKGLFKSKKAKIVKNGTLIVEQPYMLTTNPFSY